MNNTCVFFFLCLLFSFCSARSQVDSVSSDVFENEREVLLEQLPQDEHLGNNDTEESRDSVLRPVLLIRSRTVQQLQQSSGYRKGAYLGSSLKSYHRAQFIWDDHFSGGFLFSKDAGEQRFNDFSTFSLSGRDIGLFTHTVIGDYRIEAGQGIALWNGYGFSKGGEVIAPVYRKERGLISSLSSDEVEYFRGAVTQVHIGQFEATIFSSRRFQSAARNAAGDVSSLYTSGYYRTENEQSKRNNVTETLFGMRTLYRVSDQNTFGVTFYRTSFSSRFVLNEGRRFIGDGYEMISVDYHLQHRTLTLFGELATVNSTVGGIGGILLAPSESFSAVSILRSYPQTFFSYHGAGFGERSDMYNEQGWYLGGNVHVSHEITLSLYHDLFRFPAPSFSSTFPSGGHDMLADLEIRFTRHLIVGMRYRRKILEVAQPGFDYQRTQHARLEIEYHLYGGTQLRARFEKVFIDNTYAPVSGQGFAMYGDVVLKLRDRVWSNFRLTFFSTDSYDARSIFFERDLEGSVSLPALYGSGIRWYLLMRYTLSDRLEFSVKYSDIIRDDVKHIGTGLDELPTNYDNRVGIQVDARF
jgi:hypothetical protein